VKKEYDYSKGERGKFYRPDAKSVVLLEDEMLPDSRARTGTSEQKFKKRDSSQLRVI